MDKEKLLDQAKRDYPVGTKFISRHGDVHKVVNDNHCYSKVNPGNICVTTDKGNGRTVENGCSVYVNGQWAEIISRPEPEWIPKIGDIVIITSWTHAKLDLPVKGTISSIDDGLYMIKIEKDHYGKKDTWMFLRNEFRPALSHEIPQEEVEYVEYLGGCYLGFTIGKIYKSNNGYPYYDSGDKNTAVPSTDECFKPSTREAYLAQERQAVFEKIFGQEKVNKIQTQAVITPSAITPFISTREWFNLLSNVSQLNKNENDNEEKTKLPRKTISIPRGKVEERVQLPVKRYSIPR